MQIEEPASTHLALLKTLESDSITRVVYREIDYQTGSGSWRRADHHALDYGAELHLASGRVLSFTWSWRSGEFSLTPLASDLSPELRGGHATWDVSGETPWSDLLGQQIAAAHLRWFANDATDQSFGLSAKLVLANGAPIYFALGEFSSDGECTGEEAVSVFFSDAVAEKYRCRFESTSAAA